MNDLKQIVKLESNLQVKELRDSNTLEINQMFDFFASYPDFEIICWDRLSNDDSCGVSYDYISKIKNRDKIEITYFVGFICGQGIDEEILVDMRKSFQIRRDLSSDYVEVTYNKKRQDEVFKRVNEARREVIHEILRYLKKR